MGFKAGIVGLPNAGKSTLFNALTNASVEAKNYPFCTIEPNVGNVAVPDERLYEIARRENSQRVIPTYLSFVDIAGLVKGAHKGLGLGNQFLAHIREVDALVIVLRCFEDEEVVHVEGSVEPLRDAQTINLELILKDLESVNRRLEKVQKLAKSKKKEFLKELEILNFLKEKLEELKPLRLVNLEDEVKKYAQKTLFLLTVKPVLYVANSSEEELYNPLVEEVIELGKKEGAPVVVLSAKLEEELSKIKDEEEKKELLKAYGLEEPALNKLVKEGYKLLDLITFFTTGRKETRAWTVKRGTKAPEAGGKIHSDFEKGFIAVEVINYKDYLKAGSWKLSKEKGLIRLEGKDYQIEDGDILLFRFAV